MESFCSDVKEMGKEVAGLK